MKRQALLSWSSGKDSAWALHRMREHPEVEIIGLFTTVNEQFELVAMHAVRLELLRLQAAAAGLPLHLIRIPWPCSNQEYEARFQRFAERCARERIRHFVFGDLYLEDVRAYREQQLQGSGIRPLFPLWGQDTHTLATIMTDAGLRARLSCVDPKQLSADWAGRDFDPAFIDQLPDGVDPCGEHGEFHSFAYAGPMFRSPIAIRSGETVERDGFVFTDLLPA